MLICEINACAAAVQDHAGPDVIFDTDLIYCLKNILTREEPCVINV